MAAQPAPTNTQSWLEGSGLLHIFRTLGLAVHPAKIGLALGTIILTFVFGTALDWVWSVRGGVDKDAIDRFVVARESGQPYTEQKGDYGIFEVWREHGQRCVFNLMGSSVPGTSVAAGTTVGTYLETHSQTRPLRNLLALGYGTWWLCREHVVFFAIFAVGALILWALGGGAICRIAAVQFARDEKLTMRQALRFSRANLLTGFVLAPCIPLVFALAAAVLLAVFGVVLRIPFLGDLIGGLLFSLPLIGGFVVATLLVGLMVGGSLMWPAVGAEGQDAFDAFARSLSYTFSKPWKTALYAILALVYASLSWVVINLFTFFALNVTRAVVGFGTSPFGWWARGTAESPQSKLELLWPFASPSALYAWPEWSKLAWHEYISAFLIGIHVMLVVGVMFSFLVSFYYCASTVLYYLLRRDVDKTDLGDVFMEEGGGEYMPAEVPAPRPAAAPTSVSLPIADQGPTPPPPA
ncbi:MAG: hypothetical protein HY763_16325 [Planctomycetes bacterium]|nr:hypothetical protein [Planctomycetota bacterium]